MPTRVHPKPVRRAETDADLEGSNRAVVTGEATSDAPSATPSLTRPPAAPTRRRRAVASPETPTPVPAPTPPAAPDRDRIVTSHPAVGDQDAPVGRMPAAESDTSATGSSAATAARIAEFAPVAEREPAAEAARPEIPETRPARSTPPAPPNPLLPAPPLPPSSPPPTPAAPPAPQGATVSESTASASIPPAPAPPASTAPASTPPAAPDRAPATAPRAAARTGVPSGPARAAHPITASVAVQRRSSAAPVAGAARAALTDAPPKIAAAVLAGIGLGGLDRALDIERYSGVDRSSAHAPLAHPRVLVPELEEPPAPKKLTRQPAFIVSVSLAAAALVAVGVIVLMQTVFAPPATVEKLAIEDVGGSYHVTWDGPNVPYAAIRLTDTAEPADISAQIRGGRELWLPKAGGIVPADSCFVIVELSQLEGLDVTAADEELARAGAARACVRDASQGSGG